MPLDVQPLSRTRQLLMMLVMLALLGGSLGFAQLLIGRRQAQPVMPERSGVQAYFPVPPGVARQGRLPVNSVLEEVVAGRYSIAQANWSAGPRQFVAFCFPNRAGASPPWYLSLLISRLVDPGATDSHLQPTFDILGGHTALQVADVSDDPDNPAFYLLRLASVDGSIVAFCFSGDGPFTDDDWRFFDDYCLHQVRITVGSPTRK
jgi:hypothetical protein